MAKIERMNANIIGAQAAVHNAYGPGTFNPANTAGHIDAAAPKKRAPRKSKK